MKKFFQTLYRTVFGLILINACLTLGVGAAQLEPRKLVASGQVPAAARMSSLGRLPGTNVMRLALGLPLRDPDGLANFVAQISNPNSPNYRQYLTPAEITARFGPTEQDYQALIDFALTNGFTVTGTSANRLVLDVSGPVATTEKTFNVKLLTYQHPTEARVFFAPDTEPTVASTLPLTSISGLNNYARPLSHRPRNHTPIVRSKNGSSPDGQGATFGDDFRTAYVPGTKLTGAGQSVGLFEWDGSYSNAVAMYARAAGGGRTNIVVKYLLLQGFNGVPLLGDDSGEPEVDMDIEMAMAMAPGLSKIVVFEGNPNLVEPVDILNTMAASNTIKNLSSSWGWSSDYTPYSATDPIFMEMAAEGQSFFNASGDSDAFTIGGSSENGVDNPETVDAPSSSPYVIEAGGTLLALNGTGSSYSSETVWNEGFEYGEGSNGGISSYYAIPDWQTNVSMANNQGSTTQRNIPDIAADARNIYEVTGEDTNGDVTGPSSITADDFGGGTSSAAPLWAGFMALVNQQAAANGDSSPGFINPTIYAIGGSANYTNCFYDTTVGNNEWYDSPTQYVAAVGYDLCTGWGSPKIGLINALAPPKRVGLLSPKVVGSGFQFQFLAATGSTYAVQYGSSPNTGSWQTYTNITGDGTLKPVIVPLSLFNPRPQGFIRILVQPGK